MIRYPRSFDSLVKLAQSGVVVSHSIVRTMTTSDLTELAKYRQWRLNELHRKLVDLEIEAGIRVHNREFATHPEFPPNVRTKYMGVPDAELRGRLFSAWGVLESYRRQMAVANVNDAQSLLFREQTRRGVGPLLIVLGCSFVPWLAYQRLGTGVALGASVFSIFIGFDLLRIVQENRNFDLKCAAEKHDELMKESVGLHEAYNQDQKILEDAAVKEGNIPWA